MSQMKDQQRRKRSLVRLYQFISYNLFVGDLKSSSVEDYSEYEYLGALQEIESELAGLQKLMPCLESKLEPIISIQEENLAGIEERLMQHGKTTLEQFHEQQTIMENLQGTINTVEGHLKSISETIEKMDSTLTDVNNSQTFDLSELKKILSYNLSEHDRIQDIGNEMKAMETLFFEIQKNVVLKQLFHLSNEQHESINDVGEDLPKMKSFLSGIFEKLMSTYRPYLTAEPIKMEVKWI